MAFRFRFHHAARHTALAHAACLLAAHHAAQAQTAPITQTVTVSGRSAGSASIAGFGDVPLARAPFSATVINTGMLQDAGITGIGDITRLDAGVTDAYNAPGYWGQLAVRGFTLDPRSNYRRDGLPINAETVIGQANKQSLEILKGTSGLQAGTSAPGGLLNLVVKRPRDAISAGNLSWEQGGTVGAAVDLGRRSGALGWRLNADITHLSPQIDSSQGQRRLLALAVEAQLASGSLLEAELEWSRQSQPSTPGFSLLGNRLPAAGSIAPRTNLNSQPWSLPVVMDGRTGSLRYTQTLTTDVQLVAHAMRQRLDSDDRIAFPFGCSSEGNYDRYCSDGSFDLYDYRSENERRTTDAADLSITGKAQWLGMQHRFNVGVLGSRFAARFQPQAYNDVGTGNIAGTPALAPDPRPLDTSTNRDERSTELHFQDAVSLTPDWSVWLGLRHSRLQRASVRTDSSRATDYAQSFTTPLLALSHQIDAQRMVYASWSQGVETEVAPNRSRYTNRGEALPALMSRQAEVGFKHSSTDVDWRMAAFDIRRPAWRDIGSCNDDDTCTRSIDGTTRHIGVEAEVDWRVGAWNLRASATALRARRESSADTTINGLRPPNVPAQSLKLQGVYNVAAVPGLAVLAFITHEGERMVLPDNSVSTPGWSRLDVGLRYMQALPTAKLVWRAGVTNVANNRAWKEAPFQFDHAYLYPLAPRSLHASVQLNF